MRGMSMREMKARQMGRAPRMGPSELPELTLELDEATEREEYFEPGLLVDQGDGMRVSQRRDRPSPDERAAYECPDEPPPGWFGDGS